MTDFDHVRLTCPTHGPVGDTSTVAPMPALRGIAQVWCCPTCRTPIVTLGPDDWQAELVAAYPDLPQSSTSTETTEEDGEIVVRTTVRTTRGPADWTDLDQSALVALAVGSPLHRRI